mgnify:CR=1 FL=1
MSFNNTFSKHHIDSIVAFRAIAVIAVLIFHLEQSILPGGFLGVDLFFVISGFVVTKSIIEARSFNLIEFYKRRFFRLMPSASFIVLITMIIWLINFEALVDLNFKLSAMSSLLGFANITFMLQDGYWADSLKTNPFLHYWSLGVEEQYYLIWPIVVAMLFKTGTKNLKLMAALLFVSWIFTVYADKIYDGARFYSMPSRAFQFIAGAIAYQLSRSKRFVRFEFFLFFVGVLITFSCFYLVNGEAGLSISDILISTMGAFLLLLSCQNRSATRLIVNSVTLAIGKASYSIYLAHWPIIVFWNLKYGRGDHLSFIVLFFSSLAIGFICHWTIERSFQHRNYPHTLNVSSQRPIYGSCLFIFSLLSVSLSIVIDNKKNLESVGLSEEPIVINETERPTIVKSRKTIWTCNTYEQGRIKGNKQYKLFDDLPLDLCLEGEALLIGDSWGPEALVALQRFYGTSSVAALTSAGCIPIQKSYGGENYKDCTKMNKFRFDKSFLAKYDVIFIASNFNHWSKENIASVFQYMSSAHSMVYIFSNRPEFSVSVPEISKVKIDKDINLKAYLNKGVEERYLYMENLSQNFDNIRLIDWYTPFLKGEDFIYETGEGKPIFKDTNHLTADGAEMISESLIKNMTWN